MDEKEHQPSIADRQRIRDGVWTSPLPDAVAENNAEVRHFRFYVSDLLILTFGVAVGFAGGRWISPELFTFILGCITFVGMIVSSIKPSKARISIVLWTTLFVAYAASIVALVRK